MAHPRTPAQVLWIALVAFSTMAPALYAEDSADVRQQLDLLKQQNAVLQEQLQRQQVLIDGLTHKMEDIQQTATKRDHELDEMKSETSPAPVAGESSGFGFSKVHISGEGGAGLFSTGTEGSSPNSELRVDEAKLFVEAPVWNDVYAYAEVNLAQRESSDIIVRLGEMYLDFEDISKLWGQERMLNARVGRLDIPFGEEYLQRDAIDNPLISHSIMDLWGVDEGVELYGSLGKFCYVVAVQNGGTPDVRDFNGDKAIVARLGFDPTHRLHFSVSAMRTGDLNVSGDGMSALWVGNGFVRSLGSPSTTKFGADLVEGDATLRLPHGHLKAFGGWQHYGDNDPMANNDNDLYYYSLEAEHRFTEKFYAAARFSQLFDDKGFPIVANGNFGSYFFGGLTTEIWRLSLGLGWRFSDNLVLKTEYTFEHGREQGGESRNHEDMFATEAVFKF